MCRGVNECSELESDPSQWDTECLLRPAAWFEDDISTFSAAFEDFINGNRAVCLEALATIRDYEITEWFIEHGQMSGRHRNLVLDIPKPKLVSKEMRDHIRSPLKYQNEVFERDSYRCRYCGVRLIDQKAMKLFIKKLSSDKFQRGSTNLTTHGIIHATWPVADHVIPWNIGGRTNPENLVSSCASCNYGKDGYTCEQLGISDPFVRFAKPDGWSGLSNYIPELKIIA